MSILRYEGCAHFRSRLSASTLSGRRLSMTAIRTEAPFSANEQAVAVGLQDFEASFLRLIDSLSDGIKIKLIFQSYSVQMMSNINAILTDHTRRQPKEW